MKKTVLAFLGILVLVITFCSGAVAESNIRTIEAAINNSLKITLNGETFQPKDTDGTSLEPIVYKGRTYLPVRAMCDLLKIDINYNLQTSTIELKKDESIDNDISDLDNTSVNTDNTSNQLSEDNNTNSGESGNVYNIGPIQTNVNGKIITVQGFSSGVNYTIGPFTTNIKIDKSKLPLSLQNASEISVWGAMNTIEVSNIKDNLEASMIHGYGIDKIRADGFNEVGRPPMLVILFDNNDIALGYCLIR